MGMAKKVMLTNFKNKHVLFDDIKIGKIIETEITEDSINMVVKIDKKYLWILSQLLDDDFLILTLENKGATCKTTNGKQKMK